MPGSAHGPKLAGAGMLQPWKDVDKIENPNLTESQGTAGDFTQVVFSILGALTRRRDDLDLLTP